MPAREEEMEQDHLQLASCEQLLPPTATMGGSAVGFSSLPIPSASLPGLCGVKGGGIGIDVKVRV